MRNTQLEKHTSQSDSGTAPSDLVKKPNRQQISLTITPELLAKVDKLAINMGQSRASTINMAVYRLIEDTK